MENALQIKVGKRIQQIRMEKEISQQDLADLCGFDNTNISRLEAGRANATLKPDSADLQPDSADLQSVPTINIKTNLT